MEDHWAAAIAVLATEKALTRFPSGRSRSLTKTESEGEIVLGIKINWYFLLNDNLKKKYTKINHRKNPGALKPGNHSFYFQNKPLLTKIAKKNP